MLDAEEMLEDQNEQELEQDEDMRNDDEGWKSSLSNQ